MSSFFVADSIRENVDWQNDHFGRGDGGMTQSAASRARSKSEKGTLPDQQRLTFSGEQLEDERMIFDYNIIHGSMLHTSGRPKGSAAMSAEEITNTSRKMSAQLQQVQTLLAAEQSTVADLRQNANHGGE